MFLTVIRNQTAASKPHLVQLAQWRNQMEHVCRQVACLINLRVFRKDRVILVQSVALFETD